jgi:hypothetical protein
MTISIGPIRFLRSASRNSATVFASTPALRAGLEAARDVVLAALRARCWRARACPPFFAAALRFAEDAVREPEPDELLRLRGVLDDERLLEDLLLDERLLDERPLEELDRLDPPLDLPELRRSAIWLPSFCPNPVRESFPQSGTISPRSPR